MFSTAVEGTTEGVADGVRVGDAVGAIVGVIVFDVEGATEGATEGVTEAAIEGTVEGFIDGEAVLVVAAVSVFPFSSSSSSSSAFVEVLVVEASLFVDCVVGERVGVLLDTIDPLFVGESFLDSFAFESPDVPLVGVLISVSSIAHSGAAGVEPMEGADGSTFGSSPSINLRCIFFVCHIRNAF